MSSNEERKERGFAWGVSPEMREDMDRISLRLEDMMQRSVDSLRDRDAGGDIAAARDCPAGRVEDSWAIPSDSGSEISDDDVDGDEERENEEAEKEEGPGHERENFHIPFSLGTPSLESPSSQNHPPPSADPAVNDAERPARTDDCCKIKVAGVDDDSDVHTAAECGDKENNSCGGVGEDSTRHADDSDASSPPQTAESAEEERKTRARLTIIRLRDQLFAADPGFKRRTVANLNAEAVAHLKAGDDLRCVAAYAKLFRKLRDNHLVHKELYVCHINRARAYLNLGLYEEALWDARQCHVLADEHYSRTRDPASTVARTFCKAFAHKGFALMGLGHPRLAKVAFEDGLRMDPTHAEMKRGLEEAVAAIVSDLAAGKGKEMLALPPPTKIAGRIGNLPHAAPLHHIHPRDMLPIRLLTPFQAENDYHIKDTYNYMTVQADIRMPKRHFKYLEDSSRCNAFATAVVRAVDTLRAEAKDVRVLNIGCGAGLLAMEALRAGAYHVTATDRWLYHAMSAKENLLNNGFSDDQVKVVYKRPTDLAILRDVPISCNLCVNDVIDDGLLASGLIPSFKHASERLLLPDAILLPASATVYAMPVEMRSTEVCGLDVSAMNAYRWSPTYTSAIAPGPDAWIPLSPPVEVWHFDFQNPPNASASKPVDLEFDREGRFNAVVFWYTLNLIDDIKISTAPPGLGPGEDGYLRSGGARPTSLHPSVQYLPGEIKVEEGAVCPLTCAHNTVSLQFSVDAAEYLHISKRDASFPQYHFALLADEERARAYNDAICRQVHRISGGSYSVNGHGCDEAEGFGVHVLDIGAGSGLLSMMAARAGANTVVACEWHGSLAAAARRNVAANQLSHVVTVVQSDAAKLQRGKLGVRHEGCNMVVVDLFDAGLTGEHVLYMLETARRNVLTPEATVVPAAATLYCMGVEAYTSEVNGFDLSAFNKYRWDKTYESVRIQDIPHRVLTKPKKAFELFFDGSHGKGRGRESVLRLETIASGYMNAVVFWFDLHMDEHETITTAPPGVGKGGVLEEEDAYEGDEVALAEVRRQRDTLAREKMSAALSRHRATLASNPRTDLGAEAFAAATQDDAAATVTADDDNDDEKGTAAKEIIPAFDEEIPESPGYHRRAEVPEHYWGQALQYLERGVQVRAGKKVTILAKREADRVTFNLKEGVGSYVGKPPWRIEWGGGASVESPHFQRVHYCELLVNDYLMRLRSKRFPPIEKEMRMILAHCGNLFLDPAVISEMYHLFAAMELVYGQQEFSPGASMEALTKPPLLLY